MSDEKIWHAAVGGKQLGPYSEGEILEMIGSGMLDRKSHVFGQGMADWVPITEQAQFAGAFSTISAPPPPPRDLGAVHEIDFEIHGKEMQFVEIT
ncbi:MAG: DUF4339 domain-containing protein, partial [Thermoanaerobaculia bacterium]